MSVLRTLPGAARAAILAALLAAALCSTSARAQFHEELTALTKGSFTTLEHARTTDGYGVAEAEIIEIWRDDDPSQAWFYQEQAFLGISADKIDPAQKDKPYFARVIRSVETAPGVVSRSVHKIKAPERVRGAWRDGAAFAALSPDDLERSECALTVTRIAKNFWRAESEKCPNDYKGAAYARSFSIVTDGAFANWDRGFDENDALVWGPATGGYVFQRKDDDP